MGHHGIELSTSGLTDVHDTTANIYVETPLALFIRRDADLAELARLSGRFL
jgi:hypothetical protein